MEVERQERRVVLLTITKNEGPGHFLGQTPNSGEKLYDKLDDAPSQFTAVKDIIAYERLLVIIDVVRRPLRLSVSPLLQVVNIVSVNNEAEPDSERSHHQAEIVAEEPVARNNDRGYLDFRSFFYGIVEETVTKAICQKKIDLQQRVSNGERINVIAEAKKSGEELRAELIEMFKRAEKMPDVPQDVAEADMKQLGYMIQKELQEMENAVSSA